MFNKMGEYWHNVTLPEQDRGLMTDGSCIIGFVGDCLDSENSPIRVTSGSKLLVHPVSSKDLNLHIGKLITFVLTDGELVRDGWEIKSGTYMTKYLSNVSKDRVEVKCFNPTEMTIDFYPISVKFYVVDKVYTPEQVRNLEW